MDKIDIVLSGCYVGWWSDGCTLMLVQTCNFAYTDLSTKCEGRGRYKRGCDSAFSGY